MAFVAIKQSLGGGSELPYQFYLSTDQAKPQLVTLKLVCGPGEQGEMVITIMQPDFVDRAPGHAWRGVRRHTACRSMSRALPAVCPTWSQSAFRVTCVCSIRS
jgi:hypothetical protein